MSYQLGPSMMDALVLSILYNNDAYGYLISQRIKKIASLKESTLYPVLKRLLEAGFLDTYDQQFQGRNRKYYRITPRGKEKYLCALEEWNIYKEKLEQILFRKDADEDE